MFVGASLTFFVCSFVVVSLPPKVAVGVGVSGDGFVGAGIIGDGGDVDSTDEAFSFRFAPRAHCASNKKTAKTETLIVSARMMKYSRATFVEKKD